MSHSLSLFIYFLSLPLSENSINMYVFSPIVVLSLMRFICSLFTTSFLSFFLSSFIYFSSPFFSKILFLLLSLLLSLPLSLFHSTVYPLILKYSLLLLSLEAFHFSFLSSVFSNLHTNFAYLGIHLRVTYRFTRGSVSKILRFSPAMLLLVFSDEGDVDRGEEEEEEDG
ncbi:unnamed protein product [Acanthosepion pharaonis]|uniref:Uncharacterized protein n=1 Tax=Acanthosepion pharaonis TaxID=158019 RepID=A0A812ATV4_ACAPH|nr:unnamed protein product [Sepia pharaonis]